jgi:hypothetical protein
MASIGNLSATVSLDASQFAAAAKALGTSVNQVASKANTLASSVATPLEVLDAKFTEINSLFASGALSVEVYRRAVANVRSEIAKLQPPKLDKAKAQSRGFEDIIASSSGRSSLSFGEADWAAQAGKGAVGWAGMARSVTGVGRALSGVSKILPLVGKITAVVTGTMAADTLRVANQIDDLNDKAAQLGISASKLSLLNYAAAFSGVAPDAVVANITRLQKAIGEAADGSKDAQGAFARLKLNPSELGAMDASDAFRKVAHPGTA